ncbi:MAG: hypothetical protein KKG99_17230 [Bacteroidetes bacterium]|nr:hypothetical protein [Bacteroidota bacterium]
MKNKLIIVIGMLMISLSAISQPAMNNQRSIADSLMAEGEIPAAIVEYRRLYEKNPNDQQNLYNYTRALSLNRQIDSCFKYLNMAVKLDTSIRPLTEPDFLTIRQDKQWQEFEDNLIVLLNLKLNIPIKNVDYARALWKLRTYDQAYFNEIGIAGRKLGFKSSVVEALWRSKFFIQQISQNELEALIEKYGWPRIKDVGAEAAMAAYLTIMHSNGDLQNKYMSTIKQICEEKELPWVRYAYIYDRCSSNNDKPQKYGTHTVYNEKTNSQELYPLEDETKVDEWRKEIGLEPLAEYLAKMNIKYEPKKK